MDLPIIIRPPRTCGARHPTRSDVGPCLRESPNHAGEPHKGAGPFRNVVAWTTDAAPDPVPMTFTPGAVVHGRLVRMEVTPAGSTLQLVTDGGRKPDGAPPCLTSCCALRC